MGQQRRNTSIYAAVRKRCLFGSWGFLSAGLKLSGQAAANYALSWAGLDNLAYTFRTEEYAPAFVYQTCSSRVEVRYPHIKGDVLGKGSRKGSRREPYLNDLRDSPQRVGCDSFLMKTKA